MKKEKKVSKNRIIHVEAARLVPAQNGITLIALVITIIVMLILAGVAVSAIVGDNGLISKANKAGEEYKNASLNEVNIINELWEQAAINTSNQIQKVTVNVNANSSSKIVINTSVQGQAAKYVYVINDEKIETTNNSYTKSNCMYGTEYVIYVIAYDSEGGVKYSNKVTAKTKDRTYLYKEGDECTAITGGWIRAHYNCGSLTKNSTYMNLRGVRTGGDGKLYNIISTKNLIDFSEYKTIYWELEVDQCKYVQGYYYTWFNTLISSNPKTANYDNLNVASAYLRLNGLTSPIAINKRLTFSKQIDANISGYAAASWGNWSLASNPTGNLKIYNVWLEK